MPFIPDPTSAIPLGPAVDPVAAPAGPRAGSPAPSILGAAFRQSNPVVAAADLIGEAMAPTDMSPAISPGALLDSIEGTSYWEYRSQFYGLRTEGQVARLKEKIDSERADRETLDRAGGLGVAADIFAGLLSPETLIPGVGLAGTGGAIAKGARVALIAGAGTASSEAVLQADQATRTAGESITNIGGSAILTGGLGMGIASLLARSEAGRAALKATAAEVDGLARAPDLVAAKTAMANDLSAAAVRDLDLEDVTLRGGFASKAKPWINPGWLNLGAQLTSSPSAKVRDLARRTLEIPAIFRGADDVGSGVSIESLTKVDRDRARIATYTALDDAYRSAAREAGFTRGQVSAGVAHAMRRGDTHAVPAIQKASEKLRGVINDLTNRAARAGLYGAEVKSVDDLIPLGAKTYFPRMWDRQQMLTRRTEWINRVAKDLEAHGTDVQTARHVAEETHAKMTDLQNPFGGFDPIVVDRGPLKERTLNINDLDYQDFLNSDAEEVLNAWTNYMSARVNAAEAGLDAKGIATLENEINREYDALIEAAGSERAKAGLANRRDRDLEGLRAGMREIQGTGPAQKLAGTPLGKLVGAVQNVNYITILGNHMLSSIPDMVKVGMTAGFTGVARDSGPALMRGLKTTFGMRPAASKLADLAEDFGVAEHILQSRFMGLELGTFDMQQSTAEKALKWASGAVSRFSGMDAMTQAGKEIAGAGLMRIVHKSALAGEATEEVADIFRRANVNATMRRRILDAIAEHAEPAGGTIDPNFDVWPNQDLARQARAIFRAELDMIVVSPGKADKPLWAIENPLIGIVLQFKSFFLAGNARILSVMAQMPAHKATQQAFGMIAAGSMVEVLKRYQSGRDLPESFNDLVAAEVDRSGVLSYLMEANNIAEALGIPGVYAALGAESKSSRYAARGIVGTIAGPSLGMVENLASLSVAGGQAFTADTEEARSSARQQVVRRSMKMLPGGELPVAKSLLDIWVQPAAEEAVK